MNPHDQTPDPESNDTAAKELFAHGLLEFRRLDSRELQEARIRRAMSALNAEEAAPAPLKFPSRGRRVMKFLLSAAASVLLVGLVSVYFTSTEPKALALVQASIEAAQNASVRRYEVRASESAGTVPDLAQATLDVGADRRFVIRARTPQGDQIAGGRGNTGEWAVLPNGELETAQPRPWWPRWIFLLDESLTGSPDDILTYVQRDYEPRLDSTETIDGVECRHIHATLRDQPRDLKPPISGLPEGKGPAGQLPGGERPARGARPEGPDGAQGGRPEGPRGGGGGLGGPGGPGVAPELVPFLEGLNAPRREAGGPEGGPGPQGRPRDAEMGPPRGRGGPFGGGRFIPPDVVPRGEMRARLPVSIELWIDQESLMVRKLVVKWDRPRQLPPARDGMPRHPMPPSRLEFRLVDSPAATDAEGWFEPAAHR